jgi:hypothetical protein
MSWALQIPTTTLSDSSARHVLLCLANYAGTDGRGAFPSAGTLSDDTGLSERTVRAKLEVLRESGLIVPGNQALAAVYIERHDRRPVVYDLPLKRGANPAPRSERGAENRTGCNPQQNGVQISTERGAKSAPNTSLNHQVTEEQQQREISDVIAEQDRQALFVDDRQRFPMFAGWMPAAKPLADQLAIAGLPAGSVTDDLLAGFKGFFVAHQSRVHNAPGWCFQLVKWIKNQRTKSAGAETDTDLDDDSTDWVRGVGQ